MIKYLILLFITTNGHAHLGPLADDGCHYCRSNCEEFDVEKDQRHSHDGRACEGEKSNIDKSNTEYDRKLFKHWIDEDKDCQNTRHEILIERSLKKVSLNEAGCLVVTGKWIDYYFDETHLNSSDVDIDHIVPLKEAWLSGAALWDEEQRKIFANDPENLVITNKTYNRQKGAQTPLTWSPGIKVYACKYLKQWIVIKKKYELKIKSEVLENYKLAGCQTQKLPESKH